MITRRDLLSASAAGVALSATGFVPQSIAQPLGKNVHIVTGFTPGLPDTMARLMAGQMKDYAETIVVETRPGATGRVAAESLKNSAADGSVMMLAPLAVVMLFPHVYKTLPYRPEDLIPVTTATSFPSLLTVGPKVPKEVKTLADFIAWCRTNPRQASFGTAGVGSTLHFIGTMLGRIERFEYLHVPYLGRGAIDDVLKGEIASSIMPLPSSLGLVQSGDLRALATTGAHRSPFLPDVLTMAEAGYPSLEDNTWFTFYLPAKTPAPIVEKLNGSIQAALRTGEVKSGMAKLGVEIDAISMSDLARLIASESERWKRIVQETGFTPTG